MCCNHKVDKETGVQFESCVLTDEIYMYIVKGKLGKDTTPEGGLRMVELMSEWHLHDFVVVVVSQACKGWNEHTNNNNQCALSNT
jgi:hypothetical protein